MAEGTNLGTAYFTLLPSMTGTAAKIGEELGGTKVRNSGKTAGRGIGSSMVSGMGAGLMAGATALGGVVASAATAAAAGIGGLFADAIDLSDAVKKFESTMTFAGFDQATIDASRQAVEDYAAQTVYDLGEVSNTAAQLAANGITNFVDLTTALGNLNAAAGGSGETFGSVALALTQTVGAGKLTTENWNQIADAIPGASGIIQEELRNMGAYTGDFREAMANGEISAEEFSQALLNLGLTDAAREAATSTKTMEGAVGNANAAITGGLREIFEAVDGEGGRITSLITGIGDSLGGAFSDIAPTFGSLASQIEGIFATGDPAAIASGLTSMLTSGISTAFNAVTEFIPKVMATGVDIARGLAQGISSGLPDVIASFGAFVTEGGGSLVTGAADIVTTFAANLVTGLPQITEAAAQMLSGIASAVPGVLDSLLSSVSMLVNMVALNLPSFATSLVDGAILLFGSIVTAVPQVLTSVVDALGTLVGNIAVALPNLATTLATEAPKLFQAIVDAVPTLLDSLITAVTELMGSLGTALPTLVTGLTEAAPTLFVGIVEAVPGLLASLITGVTDLLTSLALEFPTMATNLATSAGTLFQGIVDALPGIWESLKAAFFELLGYLVTDFPNHVESLKLAAGGLFDAIASALLEIPLVGDLITLIGGFVAEFPNHVESVKTAASDLWQNVVQAVTDKVESLKTEVASFIQGAIDKIGEFDLLQVGIDFVQGFIDGILSMGQNIIDGVTGAFSGAVDTVKGLFGIASPSKLMFEFGGFVDEGFADGILAYKDMAIDAMADLGTSAVAAFDPTVDTTLAFEAASTAPISGGNTYNISIDGLSASADGDALDLLRQFVAGVVEVNGGRRYAFA